MADEFVMPKLGLTMEAGTIVRWLVEPGSEVRAGQAVLVIETDKVESEVEASHGGRFDPVGVVGEEYPCGARIGWFLAEGEAAPPGPEPSPAVTAPSPAPSSPAGPPPTADPVPAAAPAGGSGGRVLASPSARRVAAERGVDLASVVGSGPGGRITSEDVEAAAVARTAPPPPGPDRVATPPARSGGVAPLATAGARNLAELLGVDLAAVAASDVDPRVGRDDVAAHVRRLLASLGPPPPPPPPPPGRPGPAGPPPEVPLTQEPSSVVPLRGMRGTIARRMAESLHSMAQLTLTMDADMDAVVVDRDRRREAGGVVPGYTDYVIAATAAAIGEHPVVNSAVTSDGVALLPRIDVGMAVALDDGLIVPVIRDTPSFGLEALAGETARLAEAARTGTLTLPELEGATFSVTALGMFGVDGFTPIINAPNTAILGVGRIRDEVAWSGGAPVPVRRLTLSLTWDHRAFDGAPAARFVQSVKAALEDPARLG